MIHYVVYTHTEFLDVCNIQTDYLINDIKTLIINKNNLELDSLYSKYDNVIFYDDSLPYASRLLVLESLVSKYDYILFIHDIDVVIKKDNTVLNKVVELMKSNNIDRVDLQLDGNPVGTINWNEHCINIISGEVINDRLNVENDVYLGLNINGDFVYNVNPSIWNLKSFLEILNKYSYLTYRNIETNSQLQSLMRSEYKTYQLYANNERRRKCGYFVCLDFFEFLHITHGGRFIPLTKEGQHNSLSDFANNEYKLIVEKYLKLTSRAFRRGMSENEI